MSQLLTWLFWTSFHYVICGSEDRNMKIDLISHFIPIQHLTFSDPLKFHSILWGGSQIGPFRYKCDYIASMRRISIILDRPPTTLSRKDRLSKNWILSCFWLSQKAFYNTCKVFSKESHPQVKKLEKFFFFRKLDLSKFSSDFNDYYMKKHLF